MTTPDDLAALLAALVLIRDYEPEWFNGDIPDHSACEECARRRKAKWPPSMMCEGLYRAISERDDVNRRRGADQHYAMRNIARAALYDLAVADIGEVRT